MNLKKNKYNILITGGTGLIGTSIRKRLSSQNITILTRNTELENKANLNYINSLDEVEFNFDIIINLCGESISEKWNKERKEKIYNSRILTTQNLVEKINSAKKQPEIFISGSAIGIYGVSENKIFDEDSEIENQNLFSQTLCNSWEEEAKKVNKNVRLALLRTGVVLCEDGGILRKLITPFILGFGGKIGHGKQYLSWIHITDVINAIIHIIENDKISGPINATSPNPVSNEVFTKTLANAIRRPCFFHMPEIIAKLAFGQMGREILLQGQNVMPEKLLEHNFKFKFEDLKQAILEEFKVQ